MMQVGACRSRSQPPRALKRRASPCGKPFQDRLRRKSDAAAGARRRRSGRRGSPKRVATAVSISQEGPPDIRGDDGEGDAADADLPPIVIENAALPTPDGLVDGALTMAGGEIARPDGPAERGALVIDGRGLIAAPALVGAHGDAFERQVSADAEGRMSGARVARAAGRAAQGAEPPAVAFRRATFATPAGRCAARPGSSTA